jgi:predicted CXXCH cytochrome family protein
MRSLKHATLWGVALASAVALTIALAPGVSFADISASAHNFSSSGWSGGEICIPCHTPHNADPNVPDAPLWNHEVTTATYTLYTSGTMDAGGFGQPSGVSKLCLSCHDGTVALDSYSGQAGSVFIPANADFGTDLSNDHPVSFTYDTALSTADPGVFDPSSTLSGLPGGGNIDVDMLFGAGNDRMECASCHDPHGDAGFDPLLIKSNAASALCLTCHNK